MSNLCRLQEALSNQGIRAMVLTNMDSVRWATGFTGSFGYLVLSEKEVRFLTDSRYTIQAQEQVKDAVVAWYQSPKDGYTALAEQCAEMGLTSLGFESEFVTVEQFGKMQAKLSGIQLESVSNLVGPLRMIKTAEEIELTRKSCQLADACFTHVQRMLRPGVVEFDVALEIEFFFRRHRADLAFEPIVVSGARSALPHGRASEKKFEVGDFLTLDFGCVVGGYCSDITRTVVIGEANDRHREIYNQVLKALDLSMAMMKPGIAAKDVDAYSRQILDEIGLAKYFGHGLGHGLGKVVHDGGRLSATSEDILAVGQIWTVEPGVYIADFGGVRIEDDVVVTETGVEILTSSPKDLMVLPGNA